LDRASCGSIALVPFEKAKTLDPGVRRDDEFEANCSSNVIPAEGEARVSCSMLHARETALACKPVRALQGGIQRLSL
jgi:hypothetical protein